MDIVIPLSAAYSMSLDEDIEMEYLEGGDLGALCGILNGSLEHTHSEGDSLLRFGVA